MTTAPPPRVSVVLPTYNRMKSLTGAIQSVLSQTFASLELIVVDDGSTDGTRELVTGFQDSRIRYIPSGGRIGVSRARNLGIREARGELVAFQDSDDEWRVEKLAKQVRAFDDGGDNVSLVVCGDLFVNYYAMSYLGVASDQAVVDVTPLAVYRLPPAPCWLVSRNALAAVGSFNEAIYCYEDWELALRLSDNARILMVNEPLTLRHRTPNSLASTETNFIPNLKRILEIHSARLQAHPSAWAMYCNVLGQTECQYGSSTEGRKWFRKALAKRPFSIRTWLNLFCSCLGAKVFSAYVQIGRHWRSRLAPIVRPALPASTD